MNIRFKSIIHSDLSQVLAPEEEQKLSRLDPTLASFYTLLRSHGQGKLAIADTCRKWHISSTTFPEYLERLEHFELIKVTTDSAYRNIQLLPINLRWLSVSKEITRRIVLLGEGKPLKLDEPVYEMLWRHSNGNPMFLYELAHENNTRRKANYNKLKRTLTFLEKKKAILQWLDLIILLPAEGHEQMYDELYLELSDPTLTEIPERIKKMIKDTPYQRLINLYTVLFMANGHGKPHMTVKEKIAAVNLLKNNTYEQLKPVLVMMVCSPNTYEHKVRKDIENKGACLEVMYFNYGAMQHQLDVLRGEVYHDMKSTGWWHRELRRRGLEKYINE